MNLTISDLPPEMLCQVLRNLSLRELIDNKLVCKLWNELISSHLKVTRLVVDQYGRQKDRWWHVSRPVNEYLELCRPRLFVVQLHRLILANLRHLRIKVFNELDDFDLNDLNVFVQLVHLEVDYVIRRPDTRIDWNLPQLKILKFLFWGTNEEKRMTQISIDCPKLKALSCDIEENDFFDVKSPETITTFHGCLYGTHLAKFKNIEVYQCRAELRFVDDALMKRLPAAKELRIEGDLGGFYYQLNLEVEGLDDLRRFLKRLLSNRRKVVRPDLRLFFGGIEITDEALVDRLDLRMVEHFDNFPKLSDEHFYFGDYPADGKPNLQEELTYVEHVHYSILMSLMDDLPRDYFLNDYFERFWNLKIIYTKGEIQDPDHFAFFIAQLEHLQYLGLIEPGLFQDWYDRLPTICSLQNFDLREKDEIELNFDFLALFEPHVELVNIFRDMALQSARSLPNLIKSFHTWYVRKFRFKFRGADAVIRMRKSNEDSDQSDGSFVTYVDLDDDYDVLINKQLKLERANSTEIVEYFESLEKELPLL